MKGFEGSLFGILQNLKQLSEIPTFRCINAGVSNMKKGTGSRGHGLVRGS